MDCNGLSEEERTAVKQQVVHQKDNDYDDKMTW